MRSLRVSGMVVFLGVLVGAVISSAAGLSWGLRLANGELLADIDTTGSQGNEVVSEASFTATFFASNQELGHTTFAVTDGRLPELRAGHVYRVHFKHKYPGATRVTSSGLTYLQGASGQKPDGGSESAPLGVITRPPDIERQLPTYAQAAVSQGVRCQTYAARAVEQFRVSQARSCGFGDSRWNDDAKFHEQWCRNDDVTVQATLDETAERDRLLQECTRRWVRTRVGAIVGR